MTAYLFIGGPWDGQWRHTDGSAAWRVPVLPDLPRSFLADDLDAFPELRDVLYHRQRALVPGWRFPLTFYTTEPLRNIPNGTPLPGSVQGMRPNAWHRVSRVPVDLTMWQYHSGQVHDAIRWHEAYRRWTR